MRKVTVRIAIKGAPLIVRDIEFQVTFNVWVLEIEDNNSDKQILRSEVITNTLGENNKWLRNRVAFILLEALNV